MRELHSRLSFFKAGSLSITLVTLLSSVSAVFALTLPMSQEVILDRKTKNDRKNICILSLSAFDGKDVLAEDGDGYVCGLDQVSGSDALDINQVGESSEKEGIALTVKREDSALKGPFSRVSGVHSVRSSSHPYTLGYEAAIFDLAETKKVAGPQSYGHYDNDSWIAFYGGRPWVNAPPLPRGAIGIGSRGAKAEESIAIGTSNINFITKAETSTSVALGSGSATRSRENPRGWDPRINDSNPSDNNPWWVSSLGEVSIGDVEKGKTRHIAGVAAGLEDTDAVNVAQLKALREWVKDNIGGMIEYDEGSKLIRIGSKRSGDKIDIKNSDGQDRVLAGVKNGEVSQGSVEAINGHQLWETNQTVAGLNGTLNNLGKNLTNYLGGGADVAQNVAPTYTIQGKQHRDVGSAFGGVDNILTDIYSKLEDLPGGGVKDQDALMWSETENAFVALHAKEGNKTNSKITYLLNGDISKASTDAINGSQLYMMSNKLAAYFGGGARYENGQWSDPTFTLHQWNSDGNFVEKNYKTVADAFGGVDTVIKDIYSKIGDLPGGGVKDQDALLWSETENAFVALHGSEGKKTNSKLKFLLDGAIEQGSSEAITGNQLYMMSNKLAAYFGGGAGYENGKWLDPTFMLHQLGPDGSVVEKSYKTVADAFGGVDSSLSNLNDRLKAVEQGASPVPPSSDSDVLHWNEEKGGYDASHKGQPGKITEVADGNIAQGSKDAVNGGQLWETNERLSGVEQKVDAIEQGIGQVVDGAVSYDRDEDGNKTNKISLQGGNAGEPVVIDNVADGKIEKGSKEAVNGGQLHDYTEQQMKVVLDDAKKYTDERIKNITVDAINDAVSQAKDYTDMKFEALNYGIEGARKEARQAAAVGLAVSNLRYNDTPGKLSIAFGSGLWRSQGAFAFGAGYASKDGKILSSGSITTSAGHWGIGAGLSLKLKS
ncbi:variable outer membrane protein C [Bartonella quintana]|uniref:Vomp family autotransporter n=1 Tax=Bartonella quintana TaxID=803 RepID=UPI001319B077|nr:Vomp family autotransporter [Bartonella quintana]BBL52876.1 variable outer membrane protein C [Bartonella quintana]